MPSAGRPRSSTLDRATRQQLDELDALMQRMLALPVDPPEDRATPPKKEPVREGLAEKAIVSPDAAANVEVPAPAYELDGSVPAEQPVIEQRLTTNAAAPFAPPPAFAPFDSPLERLEKRASPFRSPKLPTSSPFAGLNLPRKVEVEATPSRGVSEVTVAPSRIAWPLYPLLWINLAFDQSTAWLGPIGRWLRGRWGRALFGWGGLLLVAAALAWLAFDGMGWTW